LRNAEQQKESEWCGGSKQQRMEEATGQSGAGRGKAGQGGAIPGGRLGSACFENTALRHECQSLNILLGFDLASLAACKVTTAVNAVSRP